MRTKRVTDIAAATALALCVALSGCSSGVRILRDQKTKSQTFDSTAAAALFASDGIIRHMTARCDGNLMVMGSAFMNGEFKGANAVMTNVEVEKPDDVAKANGDFDELVNVTYSVDAPFVRVYGVKGFGAINPETGDGTDFYGNALVPDWKPEQSRWTEPSSDRRIAAFTWLVKDGTAKLQSTTLGGFDLVAYQAHMNKDVPFWEGVHQELPTFLTDNVHKNLPNGGLPGCDQMRNPLASLSSLLAAIDGPSTIDRFFVYDSTIAWSQASPEQRHNIEQYAWAARLVTYKAGGLTPPKVPANVMAEKVSQQPTAAATPQPAANPIALPSIPAPTAAAAPSAPTPTTVTPPPVPTLLDVRSPPQPSFDCRLASSPAEKMVCGNGDLAALDVKLMGRYKTALTAATKGGCPQCRANEIAEQRQWISSVRNACSSAQCMGDAYRKRIKQLDDEQDAAAQD